MFNRMTVVLRCLFLNTATLETVRPLRVTYDAILDSVMVGKNPGQNVRIFVINLFVRYAYNSYVNVFANTIA